ncbi:glucans biosynthesis glucosyltransferase MdoH [Pseudoxanthomonas dokdonensis]|uniref:Glucans biosynthesis glucosyltransferase H n=1 Tax=Pseudoxanthomonas dokdonensis TaxID=344882 RepID=A0A0R0CJ88_9GAMM|nr:glucans biosynthesis glucosyltransferase MdoH [Pseudoxanthomonas dokdonensis]KRG69334.1 glucosyltransferase [Pseudoxanthomonas dokdonensis]
MSHANANLQDAPMLPPPAPLPMPVQALSQPGKADVAPPSSPGSMGLRRAVVFGGTALLTLLATYQIWWVLRSHGTDLLEGLLLVLFVALFAWIALSFISALAGFVLVLTRRPQRLGLDDNGALPTLASRTALLMPTYNEDPDRLLAGLQAIYESVAATGQLQQFDFFVLSDTTREDIGQAEQAAFQALRQRVGNDSQLFYRRRDDNSERKAGNIAEWVRRFGGAYPQMLILDADSLMTGDSIVRLAAAMESNPDVALIQTLPTIVNGQTFFARMQQFAGRVYGPVVAHGVAWWHGAESNYWGHNAIIRTQAFAAHAGLPTLAGRKPFAGTVLSHDFVEAALLRRGGWALHMVPGLSGSYEEGPPSLTDMLVRDRRWCQGNLQHGGVVHAKGLHWINRVHLMIGIGHYFTAPMWAMLMLLGLAIPLYQRASAGEQAQAAFSPMQYWQGDDPQRFLWVFVFTMSVLLAPKLMGYLATMTQAQTRRGCGGAVRALISMLMETLLAALMAPVTMYRQSRSVAEVLAGKDSGWETQRRDDGTLPLSSLIRGYGGLTLCGVLAAGMAYAVSPMLAAWMAPVILGLLLAIPLHMLTSSVRVGRALQRAGLLRTPEEVNPPDVIARASQLRLRAANRPSID